MTSLPMGDDHQTAAIITLFRYILALQTTIDRLSNRVNGLEQREPM